MSDLPTKEEIEDVLDWANQQIAKGGSRFHGMTYEEGVDATIRSISLRSARASLKALPTQ